jgi:hypothetical protein
VAAGDAAAGALMALALLLAQPKVVPRGAAATNEPSASTTAAAHA